MWLKNEFSFGILKEERPWIRPIQTTMCWTDAQSGANAANEGKVSWCSLEKLKGTQLLSSIKQIQLNKPSSFNVFWMCPKAHYQLTCAQVFSLGLCSHRLLAAIFPGFGKTQSQCFSSHSLNSAAVYLLIYFLLLSCCYRVSLVTPQHSAAEKWDAELL